MASFYGRRLQGCERVVSHLIHDTQLSRNSSSGSRNRRVQKSRLPDERLGTPGENVRGKNHRRRSGGWSAAGSSVTHLTRVLPIAALDRSRCQKDFPILRPSI